MVNIKLKHDIPVDLQFSISDVDITIMIMTDKLVFFTRELCGHSLVKTSQYSMNIDLIYSARFGRT